MNTHSWKRCDKQEGRVGGYQQARLWNYSVSAGTTAPSIPCYCSREAGHVQRTDRHVGDDDVAADGPDDDTWYEHHGDQLDRSAVLRRLAVGDAEHGSEADRQGPPRSGEPSLGLLACIGCTLVNRRLLGSEDLHQLDGVDLEDQSGVEQRAQHTSKGVLPAAREGVDVLAYERRVVRIVELEVDAGVVSDEGNREVDADSQQVAGNGRDSERRHHEHPLPPLQGL